MRALLVLLVFTGCGVDVCTRSQRVSEGWRTKHVACFSEGLEPPAKFDVEACTDSMKRCSDTDERRLQGYLDCLEALPACTPESRPGFATDVSACTNDMNRLSDGCYLR